jgi:LPS export ABC transporter protein LptC
MITRQGVFSSLILFAGVLFSTWVAIKSTILQVKDVNPRLVFGIGHDLIDWQMSTEGFLKSKTTAQKMLHYADGTSDFLFVKGTYFNLTKPEDPPWEISADSGVALNNNQLLKLKDHVLVTRARSSNSAALEMDTSTLNYDRANNLIYTDQFVTLKEPDIGNISTAIGLRALIDKNEVKLLKDIHTIYQSAVKEKASTDAPTEILSGDKSEAPNAKSKF